MFDERNKTANKYAFLFFFFSLFFNTIINQSRFVAQWLAHSAGNPVETASAGSSSGCLVDTSSPSSTRQMERP